MNAMAAKHDAVTYEPPKKNIAKLRVLEAKIGPAGKLSFCLTVVDEHVKAPEDAPSIGLLLCKSKNKSKNKGVAEYVLRDMNKPMGVAEYQLVESLPKDLEASLPSVEQIERELGEAEK
jgi:hypothetical protein